MKALDGDPELLLRAAGRCAALVLELDGTRRAMDRATGGTSPGWSGPGATAFERAASGHRRQLDELRAVVTRIGTATREFAHELADAQMRAGRLPDNSPQRSAAEQRITVSRKAYRQRLAQIESDVTQLLWRAPVDDSRWTGPVRPPGDWRDRPRLEPPRWTGPVRPPGDWRDRPRFEPPRWTGPVRPPGDWRGHPRLEPPRWTGPVRPPGGIRRNWPWATDSSGHPLRPAGGSPARPAVIEPVPVPGDSGGHTQLAWNAPWLSGSGDRPVLTQVQTLAGTA